MKNHDEMREHVTISARRNDVRLTPELAERMRQLEVDLQAHFEQLGREFLLRAGIVPGSIFEEGLRNGRSFHVFPKEEGIGTSFCELVFNYSRFIALSRVTKEKGFRPVQRFDTCYFSIDPDGNIHGIGRGLRHIGQAVDYEQ